MIELGKLISLFEGQPKDNAVRFDFCGLSPAGISSYRGFYEDLAIGYDNIYPYPTVKKFIQELKTALGKTFEGYKGGKYRMNEYSRIWVANYSESTDTTITSVRAFDCDYTIIETGYYEG